MPINALAIDAAPPALVLAAGWLALVPAAVKARCVGAACLYSLAESASSPVVLTTGNCDVPDDVSAYVSP